MFFVNSDVGSDSSSDIHIDMIPPSIFLGFWYTTRCYAETLPAVIPYFLETSLSRHFPWTNVWSFQTAWMSTKIPSWRTSPTFNLKEEKTEGPCCSMAQKRRCPLFSTLKVFFSGWSVPKSLSCWKSRLCECRISYGSAPNARPSHGPSVRMESGNGMITPPKTNMDGYPKWWLGNGGEKKMAIFGYQFVKFLGCRFVVLRSQCLFFLMDTNPCPRIRWKKLRWVSHTARTGVKLLNNSNITHIDSK